MSTTTGRRCAHCAAPLDARRADAVYCTPRCRAAAYRDGAAALANAAVTLLSPNVDAATAGEVDLRGPDWRSRLAWALRRPSLVEAFGEPTLTAAARALDAESRGRPTVCRWCLARSFARVHGKPTPRDNAVTRRLLGHPCAQCKRALLTESIHHNAVAVERSADRLAARRRADRGRRHATAPAGRPALSASAVAEVRGRLRHDPRECWLCHRAYSGENRPTLLAAASFYHVPEPPARDFWIRNCPCDHCREMQARHDN